MTEPLCKVNDELGVVFGWGIVCARDGKPYIDLQGDEIADDVMLAATTNFMLDDRTAKLMHAGGAVGRVVHSLPVTKDIGPALGFNSRITGWAVGVHFDDREVLRKFKTGELTGFSIGGVADFEEVT